MIKLQALFNQGLQKQQTEGLRLFGLEVFCSVVTALSGPYFLVIVVFREATLNKTRSVLFKGWSEKLLSDKGGSHRADKGCFAIFPSVTIFIVSAHFSDRKQRDEELRMRLYDKKILWIFMLLLAGKTFLIFHFTLLGLLHLGPETRHLKQSDVLLDQICCRT